MAYKLEKPYSEKQRLDFIVKYNHNQDLEIKETLKGLFALKYDENFDGEKIVFDNKKQNPKKIAKIKTELNELDFKSIRALRAQEKEQIEKYELQAIELRERMQKLKEEL